MIVFLTGGSGFVGQHLIRRLVDDGHQVRALARSQTAAAAVSAAGAEPARGDLSDVSQMSAAMMGASAVVHAAAMLTAGPREQQRMYQVNVIGTRNVVAAARSAGVHTLVYVSTEQVLLGGSPLINANETWPYPLQPLGGYGATKGEAERIVLGAADKDLRTVSVRPRFVWGPGDNTVLPTLAEAARSGLLRWVNGGDYLTSTCHVQNVVEGIVAAIDKGRSGQAYFLTDGEPQVVRQFISALLETQGVTPPKGAIPGVVATGLAALVELAWRLARRQGPPPLDRTTLAVMGSEVTVNDALARDEMGYEPRITIADGLAAMQRPLA
jgi:nucleoside-diphosphate-sugar epimerase